MARKIVFPDENFQLYVSKGQAGLQPQIKAILPVVQKIYQDCLKNTHYKISITGAQEWEGHSFMSLHHTGFAVDIRTRDLPGGGYGEMAKKIRDKIAAKLGSNYYVLLHKPPTPPHIHIQYQPGLRISEPIDTAGVIA
jgi:hypothetical protein